MGGERAVEIVRRYGSERIIVNSAADWGASDPLAVPRIVRPMLTAGNPGRGAVRAVCYGDALAAYGQSGEMRDSDWPSPPPIDQRRPYNGNPILRGQVPLVEQEARDPALAD